uniref:Uncharacterized protein n=1 Tax=Ciona intestinalis TaxID=7719 RepID=H2XUE8_CIOIN
MAAFTRGVSLIMSIIFCLFMSFERNSSFFPSNTNSVKLIIACRFFPRLWCVLSLIVGSSRYLSKTTVAL